MDSSEKSARIRRLNDELRCEGRGGQLVVTPGVLALGSLRAESVLAAVRSFAEFEAGNDPYGEHDFGAVAVEGVKVFWKIDYYDRDFHYASFDASDPDVTERVLVVMLAEEY